MSADSTLRTRSSFATGGILAVLAIALAKLILHCVFNGRYGHFRDEFDYLACGSHPAWGYVDQPPLVPILAKISRAVLGESLRAIRFLPALASSAALVLAAMIAREFGGRRFALVLTAVCFLVAPIYLSDGSLLTTNCLEPLLWMGCVFAAVRAIRTGNPRWWLTFGIIAGVGLEEKYSIAVLGFGIVVGLLLTPQRRALLSPWMWLGGVAAGLILLPNVLWNAANQWPFLQLMHNIRANGRDVVLGPVDFIAQQILLIHPLTAFIWIPGLLGLLLAARLKPYRFLGFCFLTVFVTFYILHGKNYYLAPIYPMLLAAGAVVIEAAIERSRQNWWKPIILVPLLATGAWLAPIVVPVFPVDQFVTYMNSLHFAIPRTEKSHERAALPQHYADQFGWQEMAAVAAQAWNRVPADQRSDCPVFGQNYGQAGAIDFFGPRYGLPPALSGHQSYYLWGPRGYSGNCLIILDDRKEVLDRLFTQVEYVGSSDNPYALERHIPVFLCRGAKFRTLAQLWPKLKHYN